MKKTFYLFFLFAVLLTDAQENRFYSDAYQTLDNMLTDKQPYKFKEGVFAVENAYEQGKLDTVALNQKVRFLANFCKRLTQNRELNYTERDKEKVSKYASVFTIMCQETPVIVGQTP